MKLGIMQPYFMPYIGYWQLMNAVDKYVVYDDVNYIKGGWINRNRILVNGEAKYYNLQMEGASPNKLINEVKVNQQKVIIKKSLRILEGAYKKAPYFNELYNILETVLCYPSSNLAEFLMHSFLVVNGYLGINTELILSSSIKKNNNLRGQNKVIHICQCLNADQYINAIGGKELYSFGEFKKKDIELFFLETPNIKYDQFKNQFIENLSIIDILAFNPKNKIRTFLNKYTLLGA